MKKITLMLLLITSASYSQFNYGLKGGLLLSNVENKVESYTYETDIKPGFYGGAFGEYRFGRFGIGLDVNYSDAGYKYSGELRQNFDDPAQNITTKTKINLLAAYASVKFFPIEKLGFSLGGYYGNVLSVKHTQKNKNYDVSYMNTKSDFGVSATAEYTFYKGLFAEVRYTYGLKDYTERQSWLDRFPQGTKKEGHIQNRMLGIGLGYRF